MKLIVNPHKIEIDKSPVNEREIDITKCEFEFADEITNDYVKEAYFTFDGTSYKEIIVNNQCAIPNEVLAKKGQVEIGVVAFLVENEEEIKRYNPSPAYFNTWLGSLKDNAENSEPITPSEMEQFEQALNDGLNEVANVDIDAEQLDDGMSVTITNRYGEDKTVYAYDGEKGETGATPNIQIGTVVTGDHSAVTRTGTNENPIFNFILEKGDKGDTGNGIANVTKTATSGLTDTYTITFTDGNETTFEVTNGKGISNIAKTSTSGLEDTYTITYNDNTTSTFTVTNGNGISSIEKTGTQDNVDVYTIYYTSGTTSTFTVTNSTVTNQEFQELKAEHEELVNTLPRVEGTGESITLDNTAQYKMNVALNPSELSQTTYTGANLFNKATTTIGWINEDGTITFSNEYATSDFIEIDSSSSYSKTTTNSPRIKLYDENKNLITTEGYSDINTFGPAGTYTIPYANAKYIRFTTRTSLDSSSLDKVMFVKGSTLPTSYEPYVGGVPSPNPLYPQPIKKVTGNNTIKVEGKNLYNVNDTINVASEYTVDSDGWISISYNNTGSSIKYLNYFTNNLNVKPNTNYNIMIEVKSVSGNGTLSYTSSQTSSNQGQFTSGQVAFSELSSNTVYQYIKITKSQWSGDAGLRTYVSFNSGVQGSITFRISVLEDTTITPQNFVYEPYQSQTYPINLGSLEYCKIGNYSDEFYLDNGNWYLKKNIGKVVLDATEDGWGSANASDGSRFLSPVQNNILIPQTTAKLGILICDKFVSETANNTSSSINGIAIAASGRIVFYYDQIKNYTTTQVKEWVSNNNNLTVYYALETPTSEAITDTTLINQLNNLYNQIKSCKGQTNITQTNAELPFNIDASALYDLNNLISRVATLETEV